MLRRFFVSAGLVLGIALAPHAVVAAEQRRPNIVIIMADDMGFSDLGCYGSEISTPNLDRLAASGLRFTQFYNTARCCPTRAALLTGLYPHQAGVGHMVAKGRTPAYQGYLNDRCLTIAEALKRGGYRTLMAGKWHVGEDRPHWPCDRGFDEYFGLISGGSNYFRLDPGRKLARNNTPAIPSGDRFYMTDAFTDHAVSFLGDSDPENTPFFLYVAYTAPHWPLHAWPEDVARYRGKYMQGWEKLRAARHRRMIEMGIVRSEWQGSPPDPEARRWDSLSQEQKNEMDLRMAVYAAQIDRLDQGVGRILAKLDQLGCRDNTLVMFLADNGGCAEVVNRGKPEAPAGTIESFLSYGLSWANASNTPFRMFKHWVHEGGISTPLIASWPPVIRKGGQISPQPGHVIDLMATCLDVAGVEYSGEFKGVQLTPIEGRSLRPIFQGEKREQPVLYWEHEGNRAVRRGNMKLVSRFPGEWELYDLDADRTELHNLAPQRTDVVRELAGLYDTWSRRAGVEPWRPRAAAGRVNRPQRARPAATQTAGG